MVPIKLIEENISSVKKGMNLWSVKKLSSTNQASAI